MPFAVLGPTKARTGSRTGTWVASANYEVFLREDDDVYYVFIPISGGGPRRCASPARFRRVCDGAGLTAASPRRGAKGGGGWGLGGPASPCERRSRGCCRRRGDSASPQSSRSPGIVESGPLEPLGDCRPVAWSAVFFHPFRKRSSHCQGYARLTRWVEISPLSNARPRTRRWSRSGGGSDLMAAPRRVSARKAAASTVNGSAPWAEECEATRIAPARAAPRPPTRAEAEGGTKSTPTCARPSNLTG